MKVPYGNQFPKRIMNMCKLDTIVKSIREKLTKRQLKLFKDNIYGHIIKCQGFPFNGVIVHNVLLRQVAHGESKKKDQLWF